MATGPKYFTTHSTTGRNYPRQMQEMLGRWEETYVRYGGQDGLPHIKRVIDCSIDHSMTELDKIGDRFEDPRQLNLKLVSVIATHLFRRDKANRRMFPSEDFERHQLVVDGFNAFDAFRENDLGRQDPATYGRLLETPSLGLLARMVDLTQYGKDGQASEHELSGLNPRTFYFFDQASGKTEYEHVALAAKKVYSPLADLFGYRKLAGDLMEIAYYNLHRGIHDTVLDTLATMRSRIDATQEVMRDVVGELQLSLHEDGYKFQIIPRSNKHPGKVMEKAHRYSLRDGQTIQQHVSALHDLAAFTVVLHSRNGKMLTQNHCADYAYVARKIVEITREIASLRKGLTEGDLFTDMVSNPKPNGYQSYHVDMAFQSAELVGLEAIVRNPRMHQYSERGGAAHYLYKGGGEEARTVERAYRDVKNAIENGSQASISTTDTSSYRRIRFFVQGEAGPRVRVVPSGSCIGEALICADIDLTNGLMLEPRRSLLDNIEGITELRLVHSPQKGEMISSSVIDQLLRRAILEQTRETLLSMRKSLSRR